MAADDFTFSWDGAAGLHPWAELRVLSFAGSEPISGLYRYELTLLAGRRELELDPEELVHRRATLRIRTLSTPALKVVHGVVAEAQELPETIAGQPYRVVLMPPLVRARYRRRSRVFLEKTTRQIIDAVLTGDARMTRVDGAEVDEDEGLPSFVPAAEQLTWRVRDAGRIDDPRARPYCVQYGESDLDFVSRILEAEGIGYHVENGEGVSLLVLSDFDGGRARLSPDLVGPGVPGRSARAFSLGAALRAEGVVLDEFSWQKPALDMRANAGQDAGLVEVEYPGGYVDGPSQGEPLARAALDRHAVEASYAMGDGPLRVLGAGSIFLLSHPDGRYDGEYLVTELRVRGEPQGLSPIEGLAGRDGGHPQPPGRDGGHPQPPGRDGGHPQPPGEPFHAWFRCARRGVEGAIAESRFRPARVTPRPRIVGAQTAIVTAEPSASGAEVNVDGPDGLSNGCVRVRFHWDKETPRHAKEPTSCWVRSSQAFAGGGQGAVWHPRVGVEVIVAFEEGDPDRPLVVGRLYNGQNLPPYGGSPVHSTFKSFSTPGAGTWNEVTFDDTAGSELVFVHAGKDHTTHVDHDRREQVGSDATMMVGVDDTEVVGADCSVEVGANDTLAVGANESITVGANTTVTVGGNSSKLVGGNDTVMVGGVQVIDVGSSLTETAIGAVTEKYGATRTTSVAGAETEVSDASKTVKVAASVDQTYGTHTLTVDGFRLMGVMGDMETTVAGAVTQDHGAALIHLVGGEHSTRAGASITRHTPLYLVLTPMHNDFRLTSSETKSLSIGLTGAQASATGLLLSRTGKTLEVSGVEQGTTGTSIQISGVMLDLIVSTAAVSPATVCMAGLTLLV